ncbi:calcium-binding protein E63-1 isoform X2 [Coccinella septempunctata]|uniref:calcium-binding protein E63-1 isoform X2 n=1 Tax=Coccinella septempunctata TaxID=41139 RepID=UPI001D06A473|nr:calcium-binding protein E63-1 isoform X2 [Coccinella septempunctata]
MNKLKESRRSSSIKEQFTEKELRDLRTAFELCDRNRDGEVTRGEFKIMLSNLGIDVKDEILKELMNNASHDGSETIDENDFLNWVKQIQNLRPVLKADSCEDLLAAFKVFDLNKDGYITKDELKTAMETIGEVATDDQIDDFIVKADKDKDGKINYEEFVKMLS